MTTCLLDEFEVFREFLDQYEKKCRLNFHQKNHLLTGYIDHPGIGIKNLLRDFNLYPEFQAFYRSKEQKLREEAQTKANIRAHKVAEITREIKEFEEQLTVLQVQLETLQNQRKEAEPEMLEADKDLESREGHLARFPDNPRIQTEVDKAKQRYETASETLLLFDEQIKNIVAEIKQTQTDLKQTKEKLLQV